MLKSPPDHGVRSWFAHQDRGIVGAITAIGLCVQCFAVLAIKVNAGDTATLDADILIAVRYAADTWLPEWHASVMRDLTALGSNLILLMTTLVAAGYFRLARDRRSLIALIGTVVTGIVVCNLLKSWFFRARPDVVPSGQVVYSMSFPSSHAMLSALVFLTLAILFADRTGKRSLRIYVLCIAGILAILVGCSRIYLGVHWPTDVLAGWAAGVAMAISGWLVFVRRARVIPCAPGP